MDANSRTSGTHVIHEAVRLEFEMRNRRAPRIWPWAAVAVAIVAVVFSCSASAIAMSSERPIKEGRAESCPATPISEKSLSKRNTNPESRRVLVPSNVHQILLCRYFGSGEAGYPGAAGHLARQRIVRSPGTVSELLRRFVSLPRFRPDEGSISCPFDNGARLDAVFRYRTGAPVFVAVQLRGCALVTNGRAKPALLTNDLRGRLRELTAAR
jgi:hypothetical protein